MQTLWIDFLGTGNGSWSLNMKGKRCWLKSFRETGATCLIMLSYGKVQFYFVNKELSS